MILGVVGLGSIYLAGQGDRTEQLREELGRDRHSNEARRINLSNFALAKSLLSYRYTGSGPNQRLESAIFPQDYFADNGWQLQLNQPFKSKTNTWRWDAASQSLFISTIQERGISDKEIDSLINKQASLAQIGSGQANSSERAVSRLRFGQVHFDPNKPYLATAIDVESTAEIRDQQGRTMRYTDRARIPLDKPMANDPRLLITAPGGQRLDSKAANNGVGTSAERPFQSGKFQFALYGSGLVATGRILWGPGNLQSVHDCLANGGLCHEEVFDEYAAPQFWKQRQKNILAHNQLIGRAETSYSGQDVVLVQKDSKGKTKADGKTCSVKTVGLGNINWQANVAVRQYTAFGVICSPDEEECRSTRQVFWVKDSLAENVSWQDVKNICSKPNERPECVTGTREEAFVLPAYNRGRGSDGRFPMAFTVHHWDAWTRKMGAKNLKICIDANVPLQPVAQNCPAQIASPADACWQKHYAGNWSDMGIYYINPKTCEAEFLFNRTACGCFSEDTKILMADQSLKPIRELTQSDLVWNPVTKRPAAIKRMVRGPEKYPMVHLQTAESLIKVTGNHPFPTPQGIKPAHQIKPGDIVYNEKGDALTVLASEFVRLEQEPIVWNLELVGGERDEDHFLVADGIVTGDLKIQSKLEEQTRTLVQATDSSKF